MRGKKSASETKSKKKEKAHESVDFDHLTVNQFCEALHITRTTHDNYIRKGMDVARVDGGKSTNLSLVQAINWMATNHLLGDRTRNLSEKEREVEFKIKEEKARLTKAQADKAEGKNISREDHEAIVAARASTLTHFLEKAAVRNAQEYVGKTLQEIVVIRLREVKESLDAYCGRV